jgi:hypothetical protein
MSNLPAPGDQGQESFCLAVVARKGSGKSRLVCDIIKHFYAGMFDLIVWISPTVMLQKEAFEDGTGVVVFHQWRPDILNALTSYMAKQNSLAEANNTEPERCLLILDDIGLQSRKGRLGEQLDNVAFVCRHYKISIIEISQRMTLLSTSLRSQLDALILFREQNPQERRNLFQSLGFCDKRIFFETIDKHTEEKYSFIMIRNIAGRLFFCDLDAEIPIRTDPRPPLRSGGSDRAEPRVSSASGSGVPRVPDREGYLRDLERLKRAH